MEITQHRRDVIVFSCTSDESCRRILYTLQTSQEVLTDATVAVVKPTSHERLRQRLGCISRQGTSDGPQLPQLEKT